IFALPPKWIPEKPSLDAYNRIWNQYPFGQYFLNSIIVVGGATIISLIFSSLSGYGLSRFNFKGKEWFLTFIIINQMFPSIMLLITYFSVI
ncbi:MAG: carbohydrate ABC transporter permease, partial [Actinomycetota bacterium]|nr:carbohydrate ABC transporter permease [Actinomycetota bacterium]